MLLTDSPFKFFRKSSGMAVALILVFCFMGDLFAVSAIDTIAPVFRSVEPASYSILRNNLIRLKADVVDSGSGIDSVYVIFSHFSFEDTTDDYWLAPETIARLGQPPYESVHDFSYVKDFDLFRAELRWVATDRAGNRASTTSSKIVLDRNSDMVPIIVPCPRKNGPMKAYERLRNQQDFSNTFVNGNNQIAVRAWWDQRFLYLSIHVMDSLVISKPDSVGSWMGDCIEVFLDTRDDLSSTRQPDDYQLIIKPKGAIRCRIVASDSGSDDSTWAQLGKVEVDRQIRPDGYSIDVAIPWETMKMHPRPGLAIGFDIYNTDLDDPDGRRTGFSLAGNERFNNNNPSSWVTLRLQGGTFGWLWPVAIAFLFGLAIAYNGVVRRRRVIESVVNAAPIVSPAESRLTVDAKTFIRQHIADEQLSVRMVAETLKVNEQYLSRTFNKDTGQSFSTFVSELRIEAAKVFLAQQNLSISEVAFTVGFGSANNFGKVFKKLTGLTPKVFRKIVSSESAK